MDEIQSLAQGALLVDDPDGDAPSAVSAAFDQSYTALTPQLRQMFRLISVAPGEDISVGAAAALAGCSVVEAMNRLDRLRTAHLLEQRALGRYTMHSLLRRFAAHRCAAEESESEHEAASARLTGWYVDMTRSAADRIYPSLPKLIMGPAHGVDFPTTDAALFWLDLERPSVVAIIQRAAVRRDHKTVVLLVDQLAGHFLLRPTFPQWLTLVELAFASVRTMTDPRAWAAVHLNVALARRCAGDYRRAVGHDLRAIRYAETDGWPQGLAAALNGAGMALLYLGRLDLAETHFVRSLAVSRANRQEHLQATSLANLGAVQVQAGRFQAGIDLLEQAATIHGHAPAYLNPGIVRLNLGEAHQGLGDYQQATVEYRWVAEYAHKHGYPSLEHGALRGLARVHRENGDVATAETTVLAALAIIDRFPNKASAADAHNILGVIRSDQQQWDTAIESHLRALDLATETGLTIQEAEARMGLANAHSRLGEQSAARAQAEAAVRLARDASARPLESAALLVLERVSH